MNDKRVTDMPQQYILDIFVQLCTVMYAKGIEDMTQQYMIDMLV